jgi:hypothetical protein
MLSRRKFVQMLGAAIAAGIVAPKTTLGAYVSDISPAIPVGSVLPFRGAVPSGWLLCDGRAIDKAAYPALFKALALPFGDSVPDLITRVENIESEFKDDSEFVAALEQEGYGFVNVQYAIKADEVLA